MTEEQSRTIGFIGLGNMGRPMAFNLLKAGYRLRVYNRTPKKAESLVAQRAEWVAHPSQAVERGGIVFTSLTNDQAVEQVVAEDEAFLERLGPHGIHVSLSTIAPATTRRLRDRIANTR